MLEPTEGAWELEIEPQPADAVAFWNGPLTSAMNKLFRSNVARCMLPGQKITEEICLVEDDQITTIGVELLCQLGDDPVHDGHVYEFCISSQEDIDDDIIFDALFAAAERQLDPEEDDELIREELALRQETTYRFIGTQGTVIFELLPEGMGLIDIYTGEAVFDDDELDEASPSDDLDLDADEERIFAMLETMDRAVFDETVEERLIQILRRINLLP